LSQRSGNQLSHRDGGDVLTFAKRHDEVLLNKGNHIEDDALDILRHRSDRK